MVSDPGTWNARNLHKTGFLGLWNYSWVFGKRKVDYGFMPSGYPDKAFLN